MQKKIMSIVSNLMVTTQMSRPQLAESLGMTPGFLSHLFTGRKKINLNHIAKLERHFGVTFDVSIKSNETQD